MDRIDRKLLKLLQEDASRTNADLAAEVGLSPSSCLRRIRRLKSVGVIDRVVALLDPAKAGRGMKAIVTVELERHGEQHMRRFLELAAMEPVVIQAYSVSGSTDAVLMLRLMDMDEFDTLRAVVPRSDECGAVLHHVCDSNRQGDDRNPALDFRRPTRRMGSCSYWAVTRVPAAWCQTALSLPAARSKLQNLEPPESQNFGNSDPWRCRTPPVGEPRTFRAIGGRTMIGGRPAYPAIVTAFHGRHQCALMPSVWPRRAQAGPGPRM